MNSTNLQEQIRAEVLQGMIEVRQRAISVAREQLTALEAEIVLHEAVVTDLQRELRTKPSVTPRANGVPSAPPVSPKTETTSLEASAANTIVKILQDAGKPLRAWEIAKQLKECGVQSTNKKGLLPTVFRVLKKRADLFAKIDRGVYRLKGGSESIRTD